MDAVLCHHCGAPVNDSPFAVVLQGLFEDHRLPLCRSCQEMRQSGQLPADLLVQQWIYAGAGPRTGVIGEAEAMLVQLDCLGCGASFSSFAPSSGGVARPEVLRLPDGSLSTVCPGCDRTNVLERRGGQLVAVRLW